MLEKSFLLEDAAAPGNLPLGLCMTGQIPFKIDGQMKGTVSLFDKNVLEYIPEDLALLIGCMFQNAEEQLVTFSVFDEIAFAAENLCLSKEEIIPRVNNIASQLNLTFLLDRSIHELSGGEKQRVILAANLIVDQKLLILDEPLAFLDLNSEHAFLDIIAQIHDQQPELTIVIIEHRLGPFRALINKILLLTDEGKTGFYGNVKEYEDFVKINSKLYLRDELLYRDYSNFLKDTESSDSTLAHQDNSAISSIIPENSLSKSIIQCKNVGFAYPSGPRIFNNFNFELFEGEFLGLIGENGCGKTTLLYLIAKVLTPSKGEILFKDQPYADIALSDFYQKIGFIFQNPENQIFGSTVAEEILYAPKNFGLISKDQSKTVSNADLEKFISLINEKQLSLAELSQRNPFLLSWGQKRRLNLASIFSYNPELLLIDEPFIGQDAESVQRIFEILHDYHQQGKTILLISHDLDLVKDHCSRIVNLQDLKEESSKNIETDETSLPIAKSSKTEKKTKLDQILRTRISK